ncbi:MAG: VanZ family protein [Ruminococcus sp.]|nr:VanZ family protein [Ruminococcus sp.]
MSKPRFSFRQVIFMLLSILIMILIFYFSSENADDSTTSSNFIVDFIVKVFFPKMNTYPINKQADLLDTIEFAVRKAAHFSIYAALGFCISGTFRKFKLKSKNTLITVLSCFIYACSDEFHQSFSPGRAPAFRDVMIDTGGGFFGIICFSLIVTVFRKIHNHKAA